LRLQRRADAPAEWAAAIHNLGRIYSLRLRGRRSTNIGRALAAYRAALEVRSPDSLPHECRLTASLLGDLLAAEERWDEADAAYRLALGAAETLYRSSLAPRGRELELSETRGLAWRSAFVQMRAGRLEEAVATAEHARARGIAEALARDRADLGRIEMERPELFARYQDAVRILQELELAERSPMVERSGAVPGSAARRQKMGRAASDRLERVVREIRSLPGFEAFLGESGFDEIVVAVAAGSALVYLAATDLGSMALCLVAGLQEPAISALWTESLTSADLDHLMGIPDGRQVGKGYLHGQLISTEGLEQALGPVLARLGRDLIGPLAARLRGFGVESVVLVPGGKLSLLPLHAAPYVVEERQLCLLGEVDVSYAPAARVIAAARAALGIQKALPPSLGGLADSRPDSKPLRYARAELSRIAELFPPSSRQTAMGEEATREVLLRLYGQVTHLHLACHGEFDGWDTLGSSFLLAQNDELELRDLMALRVSRPPRLVVLSACRTAVYEFQNTPDEVIGFPAGFLRSGVPGVVACLWAVEDLSTALLMMRFYELHLRGGSGRPQTPACALRQAQLWLRDLSAGELLRFFREQRELARSGNPAWALTAIAAGESRFALEEPESRPYSAFYHWAPFVFLGV
jgi:CHAT domain-containing protein